MTRSTKVAKFYMFAMKTATVSVATLSLSISRFLIVYIFAGATTSLLSNNASSEYWVVHEWSMDNANFFWFSLDLIYS